MSNKARLNRMLNKLRENNENDLNTSNQEIAEVRGTPLSVGHQGENLPKQSDFKKRFEMRKNKIKQHLAEGQGRRPLGSSRSSNKVEQRGEDY